MEQLLNCQALSKRYGYKTALDGISLTLERGRIIGLLGPNGSGKTTLIKLINGLLAPSSGSITINGSAPGPETKKVVSYLPERTYFNSWICSLASCSLSSVIFDTSSVINLPLVRWV